MEGLVLNTKEFTLDFVDYSQPCLMVRITGAIINMQIPKHLPRGFQSIRSGLESGDLTGSLRFCFFFYHQAAWGDLCFKPWKIHEAFKSPDRSLCWLLRAWVWGEQTRG